MKSASAEFIKRLRQRYSASPFLMLVELYLGDIHGVASVIRACNNNANVTYEGNEYLAYPMHIEAINEDSMGNLNDLTLIFANVHRDIHKYMEVDDGLTDKVVKLRFLHSDLIGTPGSSLDYVYTVQASTADDVAVALLLGNERLFRTAFPANRVLADNCTAIYRDANCGYDGPLETCRKTMHDCEAHDNDDAFRGFPSFPVAKT